MRAKIYQLTMGGVIDDSFIIQCFLDDVENRPGIFPEEYLWIVDNTTPVEFVVERTLVTADLLRKEYNYHWNHQVHLLDGERAGSEPFPEEYRYILYAVLDDQDGMVAKLSDKIIENNC